MMKKTGLFFGSFNPVHVGHLIIAEYMAQYAGLDEVWMVVSPQNPFKKKNSLAKDYDRLHMVEAAIGDNPKIRASDIEFGLPQPSYTVDTLAYLKEKHPSREFSLIMGGDNLAGFHKWKNHTHILAHHEVLVYQRPSYEAGEWSKHPKVRLFDAPQMNISASYIRQLLREGKSVRYLVPQAVLEILEEENIYGKLLA